MREYPTVAFLLSHARLMEFMEGINLNRRSFILGALGLALSACAHQKISFSSAKKKQKTRYFVTTQSSYWNKQNLSPLEPFKRIDLLGIAKFDANKNYTILTSVDDDGSNVQRIALPYFYHCATHNKNKNQLYLMGAKSPSPMAVFDRNTLEIMDIVPPDEKRDFGGHGVQLPSGEIAFTMNGREKGKYDYISIRDPDTLKEVGVHSTFGFQAHEIRLSPDKKYFVCGHYGSYLGGGPYKSMGIYKNGPMYANQHPKYVYPASVTFVDVQSGKRFRLYSDKLAGQEGHADSGENYEAFLPNMPAILQSRSNLETHPRFREGEYTRPDNDEFMVHPTSIGISLAYDPKFQEVIVPHRFMTSIQVTKIATQQVKIFPLAEQAQKKELQWIRPQLDFISGLAFHPDGIHYILSTSSGFIALTRGSHQINPAMTFTLPLLTHSHLDIALTT